MDGGVLLFGLVSRDAMIEPDARGLSLHCASVTRILLRNTVRGTAMNDLSRPVDNVGKRSTNLTLRTDLVREARALDINLSAAAEAGIERAVAKARDEQWIARNRAAMRSYDAFVERDGLLLGDVRTF